MIWYDFPKLRLAVQDLGGSFTEVSDHVDGLRLYEDMYAEKTLWDKAGAVRTFTIDTLGMRHSIHLFRYTITSYTRRQELLEDETMGYPNELCQQCIPCVPDQS